MFNHLPLQSLAAITAEGPSLHKLPQVTGWLGRIHSRDGEICRDPSTNLLIWRGKSLPAYTLQCQKIYPLWLCQRFLRSSPCGIWRCASPYLGETPEPLWWPTRPCHSAAKQRHPAASPTGSARPGENPPGFLRLRFKSKALLVSSAQTWRKNFMGDRTLI